MTHSFNTAIHEGNEIDADLKYKIMNLGLNSYLGAALAYGVFAVLMLFSWRTSL